MGMHIENNHDFIEEHEARGNRELKYYKDIYGNDVRLLTSKEKNFVNKGLIIASVFIVILVSGFVYRYYLLQKEIDERTKLYMTSGQSLADGKEIVDNGGVILSEDTDVVDVAEDGTIIAKASGSTNVTIYKNIDENDFGNTSGSKVNNDEAVSIYDIYNELGIDGEVTIEVIVKQAVTGVSLNMSSINLSVGETNRMVANVLPFTSYDKSTIWTSSDTSVATVDANGVVTARSAGISTITVATNDGNFKDSTLVNVTKNESKNNLYLYVDKTELYVGDIGQIEAVVSPDDSLENDIVFSSSDISVMTVNASGKIVANKAGSATITARVVSEDIISSVDITIKDKSIEKIYLSNNNLSLVVGDNVTLKAYFYPSDVSGTVSYTSSDSNVASVNSKGEVTALKEGITTIVVKSSNNVIAKCQVKVKNSIVKVSGISITLDKNIISVGSSTKIKATLTPNNVTDNDITFVSTDNSVVIVDEVGNITGLSVGTATIVATTSTGISDSVSIKVENDNVTVSQITVPQSIDLYVGKSMAIDTVLSPASVSKSNMAWESSDESIVKVSESGIITGLKAGTASITVSSGKVKETITVNVSDVAVSSLSINASDVKLFVTEKITLKASVYPVQATDDSVTWSSSDESIATVSKNGVVTGVKKGSVVIRATSNANPKIYAECEFTISKIDVESFKLSKQQIIVTEGNQKTLAVTSISPSDATYTDATYISSDTSVVTVNKKGVVTGKKPGTAVITVTVDDVSKEIAVTVLKEGDKIYFIDTYTSKGVPSDAILFESNGKYAMIDTGSQIASLDIINFLHDLEVERLEFVLITHFHSESFGGIYGSIETDNLLLSDIKIGKLYMKSYSASDSYFIDSDNNVLTTYSSIVSRRNIRSTMFMTIRENSILNNVSYIPVDSSIDFLSLGNFKFSLYNTIDQLKSYANKCLKNYNCSENSNSIVTYAEVNGRSIYLAGDIYNAYNSSSTSYLKTKTEVYVTKKVMTDFAKVDVYKASNYGSSSSNVEDALKLINPTYSVITNSEEALTNDSDGIERIMEYTSDRLYYAGDGTVILNVDSDGNIDFVQLND